MYLNPASHLQAPVYLLGTFRPGATAASVRVVLSPSFPVYWISSDGTTGQASGGDFTVGFASPSASNWLQVYGDSNGRLAQLTRVWSDTPTLNTATTGTWDLLAYTGWATDDMEGTTFTKLIFNKPARNVRTRFRYAAQSLDFSQVYTAGLEINSSYCVSLVLPPAQSTLTFINAPETRLRFKSFTFPAWPACTRLNFDAGQPWAIVLDTLNIEALPALVTLSLGTCHVLSLIYGSNPVLALQTLKANASRLGSIHAGNTFPQLTNLLAQAVNLRTILLSESGFSESDLQAVVNAMWINRTSRPTGGALTLDISNAGGYVYPNYHPNFPSPQLIANASIIFKDTRNKLLDLIALGWTVTWGGVLMTTARQSATTLRLTYSSTPGNTDAIDLWAVGDTVKVTGSSNTTALPNGNYRIATSSPEGKVWDLEALPENAALNLPVAYAPARVYLDLP